MRATSSTAAGMLSVHALACIRSSCGVGNMSSYMVELPWPLPSHGTLVCIDACSCAMPNRSVEFMCCPSDSCPGPSGCGGENSVSDMPGCMRVVSEGPMILVLAEDNCVVLTIANDFSCQSWYMPSRKNSGFGFCRRVPTVMHATRITSPSSDTRTTVVTGVSPSSSRTTSAFGSLASVVLPSGRVYTVSGVLAAKAPVGFAEAAPVTGSWSTATVVGKLPCVLDGPNTDLPSPIRVEFTSAVVTGAELGTSPVVATVVALLVAGGSVVGEASAVAAVGAVVMTVVDSVMLVVVGGNILTGDVVSVEVSVVDVVGDVVGVLNGVVVGLVVGVLDVLAVTVGVDVMVLDVAEVEAEDVADDVGVDVVVVGLVVGVVVPVVVRLDVRVDVSVGVAVVVNVVVAVVVWLVVLVDVALVEGVVVYVVVPDMVGEVVCVDVPLAVCEDVWVLVCEVVGEVVGVLVRVVVWLLVMLVVCDVVPLVVPLLVADQVCDLKRQS